MRFLNIVKITFLFSIVLLIVSCTSSRNEREIIHSSERLTKMPKEVRGVWISYLEMATLLKGKSAEEFHNNIRSAFDKITGMNLNTVIVQVRPFSDALYPSQYYPWSYTITGTEGLNPGFDPLRIMVDEAHKRNLRIEAWINPYRVRAQGSNIPLAMNNPILTWLQLNDGSVVQHGKVISLNPANEKAQILIIAGAKEIAQNYAVDGIHIDDYFYPVTGTGFDKTFDLPEYHAYQSQGGNLSHADWRRLNVENLIKRLYDEIKSIDPHLVFGISPQSSTDNNYHQQYLDIYKITHQSGYTDYIAPQIYFGFDNAIQPYAKTLDKWDQLTRDSNIDLYVGLASYKIGLVDNYAGQGAQEWQSNTDTIAKMIHYARNAKHYKGFFLYRYDHIFEPEYNVRDRVEKENQHIKKTIRR